MKRQELKALLHGVENAGEIIDQIMEINGADIENANALIASQHNGLDDSVERPSSTDMELLPLLCSILVEVPNSLCVLLISCILQNMSSCSRGPSSCSNLQRS